MVDNLKTHLPKAPPVGKGDDPFGTMFVSTAMAKVFDARSDEPRAKVATLFKPLAEASCARRPSSSARSSSRSSSSTTR